MPIIESLLWHTQNQPRWFYWFPPVQSSKMTLNTCYGKLIKISEKMHGKVPLICGKKQPTCDKLAFYLSEKTTQTLNWCRICKGLRHFRLSSTSWQKLGLKLGVFYPQIRLLLQNFSYLWNDIIRTSNCIYDIICVVALLKPKTGIKWKRT